MNEQLLLRDIKNGVATLTLNRPEKFNPLSEAMIDSLQAALDDIEEQPFDQHLLHSTQC